ncbi:MAG: cation:proton antiporter [Rikenellaceae bacterium]
MFQQLITHNIFELPVVSPELKFLIILGITLLAPLVLDKFKIPHILGLILAGAVIGEHGLNILERDSGIVMSGTAGLLYIMFLAGLEIDINEFIKNRWRSIVFGLFTFSIPMVMGTLAGLYLLHFSMITSILLASMFASYTLMAYPIISKMGLKRNPAVTVTIGGTVIAESAALLVLAVIVGMTGGVIDTTFWSTMVIKIIIFVVVIFSGFPIIARYVLKRCHNGTMQYIFVLFMLFLGSIAAMIAGVEGIIGALFTGLALNRLIPSSSALMNRIEFVGNAIFIPFFLISVGMLIDFRVFISDITTLYTALIMTVMAIISKYAAAELTRYCFKYSADEGLVIFGLSSAHAAATLAIVLVGYNTILGVDDIGEPIRLLNSSVLNGSIVMIFFTCTVATIAAQRGANRLAMREVIDLDGGDGNDDDPPKILLPLNSLNGVGEMVSFTHLIAPTNSVVMVASVVSDAKDEGKQVARSKKVFDQAVHSAAAIDLSLETILRYDTSYTNGISNIVRENNIGDLILNIDTEKRFSASVITKIIEVSDHWSSVTTYMYRAHQPVATIRRHLIIVPANAEHEMGFRAWVIKVWSLLRATGASATIYATKETITVLQQINQAIPLSITFVQTTTYSDLRMVSRNLRRDDGLIFILSKRLSPSYDVHMDKIPEYINNHFTNHNFILVYPYQTGSIKGDLDGLTNVASQNIITKIEDVIDSVIGVIKT